MLDELGLEGELDLEIRDGSLVLSRARRPREGWDRAFARMRKRTDDRLVHGEQLLASSFDKVEWEW